MMKGRVPHEVTIAKTRFLLLIRVGSRESMISLDVVFNEKSHIYGFMDGDCVKSLVQEHLNGEENRDCIWSDKFRTNFKRNYKGFMERREMR